MTMSTEIASRLRIHVIYGVIGGKALHERKHR